jgi:anti-sigma regulatory factor (Ser/Thr protein kinase)
VACTTRQAAGKAINSPLLESKRKWKQHGESGLWVSDWLPYTAECELVLGSRTVSQFIWDGANMGRFLRWGNWAVAKMIQVLTNLISNALKYSPSGGTVAVRAWDQNEQLCIAVTDQGIGIDKDDLRNIFKPFHRTKETRNTIPGIGLGLSASQRIIQAHGGQLSVQSERGSGSTFTILMPNRLDCQQPMGQCELMRVKIPAAAPKEDDAEDWLAVGRPREG